MTYYKMIEGEWVECPKEDLNHRDRYKRISPTGGILISYWYDPNYDGE